MPDEIVTGVYRKDVEQLCRIIRPALQTDEQQEALIALEELAIDANWRQDTHAMRERALSAEGRIAQALRVLQGKDLKGE